MLENYQSDHNRIYLSRDFAALGFWALWYLLVVSSEWPAWMSWTGLGWLLLYGVNSWGIRWAAFQCLLIAWVYCVFSMAGSGSVWLSLFAVFLVLRLIQLRIYFQSPLQWGAAVFASCFLFEALHFLWLVFADFPFEFLWTQWALLIVVCFGQALAAYLFRLRMPRTWGLT